MFLVLYPKFIGRRPQAERAAESVNWNLGTLREVVYFSAMRTVTENKFGDRFGAADNLAIELRRDGLERADMTGCDEGGCSWSTSLHNVLHVDILDDAVRFACGFDIG